MNHRNKMLFGASLGLNIILIAIAAWGMIKINFVQEQVLLTEIQHNLVELEGLIAVQSEQGWPEPNLVTGELGDVLSGIWLGMKTGEQLGALSAREQEILNRLYSGLIQYPNDELYRFIDVTEEDKAKFEKLRIMLREESLGLNLQIDTSEERFMIQAEHLNEKIKFSPNK